MHMCWLYEVAFVYMYIIYFYINNLFLHELRYNIVDQCSFMYSLENILNAVILLLLVLLTHICITYYT